MTTLLENTYQTELFISYHIMSHFFRSYRATQMLVTEDMVHCLQACADEISSDFQVFKEGITLCMNPPTGRWAT